MAFWKKIFFEERFSMEDMIYLSRLLDTSLPLNECLMLIETRRNKALILKTKERLNAGESIEEIVKSYLPKRMESYVLALLNSLPFSKALSLSLDFLEDRDKQGGELLRAIAYPCLLLFLTVTALYLFDLYGIDSIFALFRSLESDMSFYDDLRLIFRIAVRVLYCSVALIAVAVLIGSRPKNLVMLYIFLSRHFPNSLLNISCSAEFMSFLLICIRNGFHTKESLDLLKNMKKRPIISFLAFHLDEKLMEGETLKEAVRQNYYDSALIRFIKIANYTGDFGDVIGSYVQLSTKRVSARLKKYTLTLQLFTYALIGMIIIFIYRILFMPMQAIAIF
ncbi:MAG: type II secretion system F family protein [Erysipelotrichaceae bacterium]|nr:type II secretion system F family protein [Erysipelotrichaceae bacterium]